MKSILTKIFGTKHERDAKKLQPLVDEINEHFEKLKDLSEEALVGKTEEFKKRLAGGRCGSRASALGFRTLAIPVAVDAVEDDVYGAFESQLTRAVGAVDS